MDRVPACRVFRFTTVNDFLMVSKNTVPTVPSFEKICQVFGITLAQLFAETGTPVTLTESQEKLLDRWARLDEKQQAVIFQLLDIM